MVKDDSYFLCDFDTERGMWGLITKDNPEDYLLYSPNSDLLHEMRRMLEQVYRAKEARENGNV